MLTYPDTLHSTINPSTIAQLPVGFHDIGRAGFLSHETIDVLRKIQKIQIATTNTSSQYLLSTPPFLARDDTHLYFNLTEECPALALPDDERLGPPLDKLVSMALVRLCANGERECTMHTACIYYQLHTKLTKYILSNTNGHGKNTTWCMLWIWLITIASWTGGVSADPRGVQLVYEMRFRYPETVNWSLDDFALFGQRFFWNEITTRRLKIVFDTSTLRLHSGDVSSQSGMLNS